jgi:hypothetical protein
MTERRRSNRFPGAGLRWRTARLRPGRDVGLVDVASGGALVEGRARLAPGARVVLQLRAEDETRIVHARVLRCEVSALDPARGVLYRGALRFDEAIEPGVAATPAGCGLPATIESRDRSTGHPLPGVRLAGEDSREKVRETRAG